MTHVTCRLTAKNRDQLRNPTLGNRVWATFFTFSVSSHDLGQGLGSEADNHDDSFQSGEVSVAEGGQNILLHSSIADTGDLLHKRFNPHAQRHTTAGHGRAGIASPVMINVTSSRTVPLTYHWQQYCVKWHGHTGCCPGSGVVSGTTVRALVLGRFRQKKLKIELKDNAKKWIRIFHIIRGRCFGNLGRRCLLSGCKTTNMYRAYRHIGKRDPQCDTVQFCFHSGRLTCSARTGFRAVTTTLNALTRHVRYVSKAEL